MGKQGTKYNCHRKIKSNVVQMEEHFSEYVILVMTIKQSINMNKPDLFAIQKSNSTLDDQGRKRRKPFN